MSCDSFREAIGDYMDGLLEAGERQRFEEHLRSCAGCRTLAEDLARIKEAASSLPLLEPPGRVWERISTEIGATGRAAEVPAAGSRPGKGTRRRFSWLSGWLVQPLPAMAGALVIIVAVAAAYVLWPRQPSPAIDSTGLAGSEGLAIESVQNELRLAEQHFENAIAGLEKIKDSGRDTLDPQIADTLDRNLAIIDQAIEESRNALASQPDSELARETLFEGFRRKVALLQDTIALINEMRKGNQAGAARIVGGLDKS